MYCIVSSSQDEVHKLKRESYLEPSDASSDFGSACLERDSKVIGSSE